MFQLIYKSLVIVIFGLCQLQAGLAYSDETLLKNIEQLTTPEMGFERAGEAYFSPDDKMISFQAIPKGENGYQIFTLDLTTRKLTQISRDAKACTCSYFHPDGKKMIFAASAAKENGPQGGSYKWDLTPYMNIYEANIDGTEPITLTQGPAYHAECAYSPDGEYIVYASNEDGSMNIYTMRSDGTDVKQLTHTDFCYNGGPFFSPDGKKIVFRADRETPDLLQVYVMDSDGSHLTKITDDDDAVNWAPFWHPSQKAIAYTTSIHGHHRYEIYLISTETGEKTRVTDHPGFDGLPTFNRQGTKMLWTSKRGPDKTCQIFIADFELPNIPIINRSYHEIF